MKRKGVHSAFRNPQSAIKVLTVAGSDPSGGAGIQLDLKVFQKLGAFGMAIPAALTIQNSKSVSAVHPVPANVLSQQIDAILSDIKPDAIKTGMLLTLENVEAVADAVRKAKIKNLIVDPVLRSSSGALLLKKDAIQSLKKKLLPLSLVVTPNLPEAKALTGMSIQCGGDIDFAAGMILDMGPSYVLIKGGHAKGPAVDVLYGGNCVYEFSTNRQKGDFHGTGCLFSSAITVFIARGLPVEKAVEKSKQFVDLMLKSAKRMGKGKTKYFQL